MLEAVSSSFSLVLRSKSPTHCLYCSSTPYPTLRNMSISGHRPCLHLTEGWSHSGSSVHVERLHVQGDYFFSIQFSWKSVDARLFGAVCCFSWFLHFPLFFMERIALISCKALQINIKVRGWKHFWSYHGTSWFHWAKKCFQPQRAEVFQNKSVSIRACASAINSLPSLPACILTTLGRMEIVQNLCCLWTTK